MASNFALIVKLSKLKCVWNEFSTTTGCLAYQEGWMDLLRAALV